MTAAHPAWKVLGIDPTSDQRAIRMAYSAKLKTIDPEADPQAFVALRDAFEAAREAAASESADTGYAPVETGPAWEAAPSVPDENAAAEPVDEVAAHADAIANLLYNHDPGADFLDDAAKDALLRHWQAIAADPRLEDVALFDRVEQWAGSIILDTAPRSAPLVMPVSDFFRWLERAGTLAETPGLARILHWYNAMNFIALAQQPDHSHHAEWIELDTPAGPESKRGTIGPRKLYELLDTMRWSRPDLVARLDPERLALWDRKAEFEADDGTAEESSGYSGGAAIGGGIGIIWLFILMARACAPEEEPRPQPQRYDYSAEPVLVAPPQPLLTPAPGSPSGQASPVFISPERLNELKRRLRQDFNKKAAEPPPAPDPERE